MKSGEGELPHFCFKDHGLMGVMLKFNELLSFDSSLKLMHPGSWENMIEGLTDINELRANHLIFIKSKAYLELALKQKTHECAKSVGVIILQKIFEKEEDKVSELQGSYGFIMTSENIDLSMSFLSKPFHDLKMTNREKDGAEVHPNAWVGEGVVLGDKVVIEEGARIHSGSVVQYGSHIGKNTEIFPNVIIYPNVSIGENCRIHSSAVIGADGFGYNYHEGAHHKVWHMGGVCIGDDVEIGAVSAVDGGTFSPTYIGDGTKLDNHVQIGHNCNLGKGVIVCGHVAIGGSTEVGDFTVFGGKSGTGHGLNIGKNCQIAGGGLVNCDWPDGSIVGGHPARPLKEWMRGLAFVRKESLSKAKK